jgi:hypothetical protein
MRRRSFDIHGKAEEDSTQPSFYTSVSLLDTVGKNLEKFLLTSVLRETNERRFLPDEQFGFRHKEFDMQLAHLAETTNRNFKRSG